MNKLTQLRLLKEMVLSEQDALHYITTHSSMQHPVHGPIPFQPQESQMEYLNALIAGDKVILKAARQTGTTIATMMYIFYYAMFNSDKTILLTSNTLDQAFDNLQRIRYAFDNLHDVMRGGMEIVYNHKHKIEFSNGTRIIASGAHASCARGMTVNLLHIDNFELISTGMQEDLFQCIWPGIVCNKHSQMIITSTSPGQGSRMFNDLYYEAEAGKNGFTAIRMDAQYTVPAIKSKNPNQSIFNIPDIKT